MTAAPYRVVKADHWALAGTGLEAGDTFGEKSLHERIPGGASGHETDKRSPSSPAGVELLAKGLNPDGGGAELVTFETASGGAVFSAASICWPSAYWSTTRCRRSRPTCCGGSRGEGLRADGDSPILLRKIGTVPVLGVDAKCLIGRPRGFRLRGVSSQETQLPDPDARPTRARYTVLGFLCSLALVLYLDRVCIGQALPEIERDLGLTKGQSGYACGAFLIAYGLFEVPSGRWGDRFGSRGVLARIVVWWSLFTALTGAVGRCGRWWRCGSCSGRARRGLIPTWRGSSPAGSRSPSGRRAGAGDHGGATGRGAGAGAGGLPDRLRRLAGHVRGVQPGGRRLGGGVLFLVSRRSGRTSRDQRRRTGLDRHQRRRRAAARRASADPLAHDPGEPQRVVPRHAAIVLFVRHLHGDGLVPDVLERGARRRPDRHRLADVAGAGRRGGWLLERRHRQRLAGA